MGIYIDSMAPYTLYQREKKRPFFVDKSEMLSELIPLVEEGGVYICVTRPRRFGKTVAANMISAFFSRAFDSSVLFSDLKIAENRNSEFYRNRYPVIHISFNDVMGTYLSYEDYIRSIEDQLKEELKAAYPKVRFTEKTSAAAAFMKVYSLDPNAQFIFILDEWDFIFHQSFATEENKREYLLFLRNLLKDRPYVLLAYMTGILPIAKYSSGSELNMFSEYTMATEERFSEYFGFTEAEVDQLYVRYRNLNVQPVNVTREGLDYWYNGYHTRSGERLYNPRSVVQALTNNNLGSYWTGSGPYDEVYYYIEHNVDAVRDDLACMVAGIPVKMKIREYAATARNLRTREEILSAMVVYGFLSYENGWVSIPNKELMNKFNEMLQKETSLGYVYRLAVESERMLKATLAGDTDTMKEILELVHNTEVPLLNYNHETELAAIINLIYLSARDTYRVEREDKAGTGYVDFIFYPETDLSADAIILELKIDKSPEDALRQIKDRNYMLRFQGKLGEKSKYKGRILGVGISYGKHEKKHSCKVEILREREG